ncbi:hypothetical protein SBDP1_190019 [Syntrophobacter sp. SbD1]|nr:hypothetical protein SBDP1_190019 [Syntrophobacter sp. SbD1]
METRFNLKAHKRSREFVRVPLHVNWPELWELFKGFSHSYFISHVKEG